MPICFLALDRLNLQFPLKELARWMQAPTVGNLEALKRVARYLIGHGLFLQEFVRQIEEPSRVVEFTDSDHAGCLRTRKSASSSKLFYVSHMLHSTSTKEGVIALSSEESELYTLVKGTSAGLGAVSMLKDLGVNISKNTKIDQAVIEVRTGASPGRGKAVQRGAWRIRHIATPTLWVQKLTQDGRVKITKILGASNLADLGTRHFDGGSVRRALEKCHCYVRQGRSGIALRAEV